MPMFTQKHYVAIAQVIHARRVQAKADGLTGQIPVINEITNDMVKLFKADNPKFRDLIFVEACCKDMRDA